MGLLQNYRPPISYRPPTTDHRLTDRSSTDPLTTDHRQVFPRPTDSPTTDVPNQLTTNPLTQQTYLNRVATGPILSLINFNLSFGLRTIYY